MSTAKHTPGPWRIVIDGTCSGAWPFVLGPHHDDDCSDAVAELPTSHVEKSRRGAPGIYSEKPGRFKPTQQRDEVMANARLIAAAPELLAFVAGYLEDYKSEDGMYDNKHYAKRAAELIAKATGSAS